jgi:SAM domain (Sterile alpha motif)
MDIVVWLRSLGLGQYKTAFRENEITEKVLPSLTAEDLKEIGVGPVGHRRILLEAIAALRNEASGKAPPVDTATTSSAPSAHPEDRAERRQVTVMFSDLVGSTGLTAALLERVAAEPHIRSRNFCSSQHTDSALYPTIGQMERAAGFRHDDTAQAKLDKLDALLAQSSTSPHDAALLAEMLSLPNDGLDVRQSA